MLPCAEFVATKLDLIPKTQNSIFDEFAAKKLINDCNKILEGSPVIDFSNVF